MKPKNAQRVYSRNNLLRRCVVPCLATGTGQARLAFTGAITMQLLHTAMPKPAVIALPQTGQVSMHENGSLLSSTNHQ